MMCLSPRIENGAATKKYDAPIIEKLHPIPRHRAQLSFFNLVDIAAKAAIWPNRLAHALKVA